LIFGDRAVEPKNEVRAPRKFDAERDAARDNHEQTGRDDKGGQHGGLPSPPEKIEIRVLENMHG
jgi:hypothetical protein